ncbi:MAG: insulinase family protein [Chitinophagaceae bacterium]|nr:insulinase family protein [Chitinophagaceae bacterium]
MKKIFLSILITLPVAMLAQVDRSKAPTPGAAPLIKVAEPASFTLANGLKVFVVTNTKLPRVSATLTFDRDGIVEGDKAGMMSMGGELLRRGTSKMNKATLDEEIDYLGATINTSALSVNAVSLKNNFPKVFGLMADIVLRPSFPADELEKIRKTELSGLAQNNEDANVIASNVSNRLVYGKDHPYGEVETEETAKRVTVEDIRKFYSTYWKPNIAYLIFVGDITAAEARQLAETQFGGWQRGVVPGATYPMPAPPAKTYIAVVDRPSSVQSVIRIMTPIALKPGTPNAIPSSVMNNLLGNGSSGRLYKNLREKYGFTYGAYSQIHSDRQVGYFMASTSVRNEKTDSAIGQLLYEFNRMRNEMVAADDISRTKNEMSGSFARSLETPATIASFALNVARYNLPKDYYQNYLKNLAAVDAAAVKAMADNYVMPGNMHIIIVGNAKQIAPGLEKYGEVRYFDVYGNPKAAPVTKQMGAGVTAESILNKAIAAQGGEAAMAAIKDLSMTGTASVMGQSLGFSQQYIPPSGYVQTLTAGGMVVAKQMKKKDVYKVSQQGQDVPLEDKEREELDEGASLFLEPYLLKKGYKLTVKGIEQVDGKDAYVLEAVSPKGITVNHYYDLATGLRVKESKTEEGSASTAYIKEYKTYNGVKIPVKMLIEQGPVKIDFNITEVKVNQGLSLDQLQ